MNVTAYSAQAYGSATSDAALGALRATGTDHVAIVVFWYMTDRHSTQIAPDPHQTPTDASLVHAMVTARSLGLEVALKPQVDVRDGTFRGDIQPSSAPRWFAAYTSMVNHYAALASRTGARTLIVGDELTSMARDQVYFRAVIASARARFHGRLTYAANWVQGAEQIAFWDALDAIGIDAYMPLTPGQINPSVATLTAAWKPWIDRVVRLRQRWGRPVLFTELGYASRSTAAQAPANEGSGSVDDLAQARAYAAALRVWRGVPGFAGIYWWDWSADGHNAAVGDGSYRPAGKLAEAVLRQYNDAPLDPRSQLALRGVGG
ncbi:MAG TPA: hypothetical protein VGN69_05565 [Solirubrobacteraceae bacterium]|jgi:hypothetical protein|nr:hypothetical protein [Solirubrobacteraceae bacterium]